MSDARGLDPKRLATLVVAETKAPHDIPFARLRGLAFLQQQRDERLASLARRLARLIGRVRDDKLRVTQAWLLLDRAHDDHPWLTTRTTIAGMLGQAVEGSGGKRLTIVARADASAAGRAAVYSLAGTVLARHAPGGVTVHVRFVPEAVDP